MHLTEENFKLIAAKHYNNPRCISVKEFYNDVARFRHLKNCITKYYLKDELEERLILNHLIVLGNMFGVKAMVEMIMFKVEKQQKPILKTFLIFLNYIETSSYPEIPLDQKIVDVLRKL